MIFVKFTKNIHQEISSLSITGHADFADYGSDIVCSAVSALTFGIINSISKRISDEGEVVVDEDNGGLFSYELPKLSSDHHLKAQLLLGTLEDSLKDIQTEYPENIRILKEGIQ